MNSDLNIVCVLKQGKKFRFSDVLLLSNKLHETWEGPGKLNVICLWDQAKVVYHFTTCKAIPMEHTEWIGWWSKMNLFSPALEEYRPFLFLDLDTAIVGDIQSVLPPEKDRDKFISLQDFYRPTKLAGGMFWIPAKNEKVSLIWKKWLEDPTGHSAKYRGEGMFIMSVTSADMFFQSFTTKISSFKPDRKWLVNLPKDISVVCFHGVPNIPEAAVSVPWVNEYVK